MRQVRLLEEVGHHVLVFRRQRRGVGQASCSWLLVPPAEAGISNLEELVIAILGDLLLLRVEAGGRNLVLLK